MAKCVKGYLKLSSQQFSLFHSHSICLPLLPRCHPAYLFVCVFVCQKHCAHDLLSSVVATCGYNVGIWFCLMVAFVIMLPCFLYTYIYKIVICYHYRNEEMIVYNVYLFSSFSSFVYYYTSFALYSCVFLHFVTFSYSCHFHLPYKWYSCFLIVSSFGIPLFFISLISLFWFFFHVVIAHRGCLSFFLSVFYTSFRSFVVYCLFPSFFVFVGSVCVFNFSVAVAPYRAPSHLFARNLFFVSPLYILKHPYIHCETSSEGEDVIERHGRKKRLKYRISCAVHYNSYRIVYIANNRWWWARFFFFLFAIRLLLLLFGVVRFSSLSGLKNLSNIHGLSLLPMMMMIMMVLLLPLLLSSCACSCYELSGKICT